MHKAFPDWYQLAAIKPTSEMLAKRWPAVETMAKWDSTSVLQDLVRLVRGTCPTDAAIRTSVVDAARAHDIAFSGRDNDAELRVLAGATVVSVLETPSDRADLLALALVSATFQGQYGDAIAHEFLAYARQYLANEAVRMRAPGQRPDVPDPIDLKDKDKDPIGTFRTAVAPVAEFKQTVEPIVSLANGVTAGIGNLLRVHAKQVYRELDSLREESNMFWWVFSGYSRDLERPFRALGLAGSCLIAAKELADLTQLFPGPRAAPALLERVLSDVSSNGAAKPKKGSTSASPTIQISEAVNAVPREWRARWVAECPPTAVRELTPLLMAVQKSLDTDSLTDWISVFTKWTTLPDGSSAPKVLAMQAYVESVLTRVIKTNKA